MTKKIEPLYAGLAVALATLYSWWGAYSLWIRETKGQEGPGLIGIFLIAAIAYFIIFVAAGVIFNRVLIAIDSLWGRLGLIALALGLFLSGRGAPFFFVYIVAIVFFAVTFFGNKKDEEYSEDLDKFLDE